ncbi:hypothetical protein VPH35_006225 [Triticum aestivum]
MLQSYNKHVPKLIKDFIDEVWAQLKMVCESDTDEHAFGRTALLLSGGASLGSFHVGVVKTIVKKDAPKRLLPRIVTGSSVGSIICSIVATRTWPEIKSFFILITDLKMQGLLRDRTSDLTFQEAYDITGRVLGVTVCSPRQNEPPRCLNYLTSPYVVIWIPFDVPFATDPERRPASVLPPNLILEGYFCPREFVFFLARRSPDPSPYLKIIQNPTYPELQMAANQGRRCTWEKLFAIRANSASSQGYTDNVRTKTPRRVPSWSCISRDNSSGSLSEDHFAAAISSTHQGTIQVHGAPSTSRHVRQSSLDGSESESETIDLNSWTRSGGPLTRTSSADQFINFIQNLEIESEFERFLKQSHATLATQALLSPESPERGRTRGAVAGHNGDPEVAQSSLCEAFVDRTHSDSGDAVSAASNGSEDNKDVADNPLDSHSDSVTSPEHCVDDNEDAKLDFK